MNEKRCKKKYCLLQKICNLRAQTHPALKPTLQNIHPQYMQFSNNTGSKIVRPAAVQYLDGMSVQSFNQLLAQNPGHVILKLGAEWCGPCKKIEPLIDHWFAKLPDSVSAHIVDIDESFELYASFKTKRQINGIPAILCFRKGNESFIPDFAVTGSGTDQINTFFIQLLNESK